MLTVEHLLNDPVGDPSDNACELGQEVIFQKSPKKSKETAPLPLDIRKFGY